MKVFLAGIIQGSLAEESIHQQDWREPITRLLVEHVPEAEIYCHYSVHPNSITYGMQQIVETFEDGLRRAHESDLVICWVPEASMGTAIEMYEAYQRGAAVVTISPMSANWVLRIYSHELLGSLEEFAAMVQSGRLRELVEDKRAIRERQ
ncbi:MAG: hypothetical protein ACLFVU_07140 [Phycisphaerae bacterium]